MRKNGTPHQAAQAVAITLKNMMGLICDPVAGLVEVPCVKRNALGSSQAFISADMALAGIESVIPPDEVVALRCIKSDVKCHRFSKRQQKAA